MKVNQIKNLATAECSCYNCRGRIDKEDKHIGWFPFADGVEVGICGGCNRLQEQERKETEEEAARDAAEEEELCNSMLEDERMDEWHEDEEYDPFY